MTSNDRYIFTSESVTEGHPDKVCDKISDSILDALIISERKHFEDQGLSEDEVLRGLSNLRCACETFATTGTVFVAGEIRCESYVDVQDVVRKTVDKIGYNRAKFGFDGMTCGVINAIHEQSLDIARGVDDAFDYKIEKNDSFDKIGAGDQGSVFGYACKETKELMPLSVQIAHRLTEKLDSLRKSGKVEFLRPDGKAQVSVVYENGIPVSIDNIVLSAQHSEKVSQSELRQTLIKSVVGPVLEEFELALPQDCKIYTNPTGRFVVGGPMADTGLTGRKIIVDTYGGIARHGGGAFSGKDPTKVDRSASYAARYIAKNVVEAGLCDVCELEISYAIGICHPLSVFVDTHGTNHIDNSKIEQAILEVFDLRPAAIIDHLDLWRPIYSKTSNYGHFGRELPEFSWEKKDKVEQLNQLVASA